MTPAGWFPPPAGRRRGKEWGKLGWGGCPVLSAPCLGQAHPRRSSTCTAMYRLSDSGIARVGASRDTQQGATPPFRAGILNFAVVSSRSSASHSRRAAVLEPNPGEWPCGGGSPSAGRSGLAGACRRMVVGQSSFQFQSPLLPRFTATAIVSPANAIVALARY